MEDDLREFINYIILPLFAFVNEGIFLGDMAVADLVSGVSLSVMLGLVVGKFVGVFTFSWVAIKTGVASMPTGASWKSFASVCVLCGIGFTVSMFIADLAYSSLGAAGAAMLDRAKLGILVGTVIAAVIGAVMLNVTLPKKEVANHN